MTELKRGDKYKCIKHLGWKCHVGWECHEGDIDYIKSVDNSGDPELFKNTCWHRELFKEHWEKVEGTMPMGLMEYSELYTVFEKLLDKQIVLKNEAAIHQAELRLREVKGDSVEREIEINAMVESFINNKMKFPVASFEMKSLEE